jgi:hypothetical protein
LSHVHIARTKLSEIENWANPLHVMHAAASTSTYADLGACPRAGKQVAK